ncbi:hypothetical protein NIES4075_00470 [Tolypothrix sp. NIES-4075]|uniref:hypothetical protein n=1 Tax=Tolypothrix sp. NIES-4075 TaxID=2005459 RepID=UPI000B5CCC4B|nr:hypothetical protein [Tolypothrix sp. NIES-4075]GAX39096.1 hypothetical protein NIES4075_00470 [Tolypothrix sp. NIES-4075]
MKNLLNNLEKAVILCFVIFSLSFSLTALPASAETRYAPPQPVGKLDSPESVGKNTYYRPKLSKSSELQPPIAPPQPVGKLEPDSTHKVGQNTYYHPELSKKAKK